MKARNSSHHAGAAMIGLAAAMALGLAGVHAQSSQPKVAPAVAAKTWHVGDKVSVYVSGSCCYDGTVAAEGSGSMAGYYLIHFDNPSSQDQYAKATNIVARRGAAPAAAPKANLKSPDFHCAMGTIGGKPACLPTAAPR